MKNLVFSDLTEPTRGIVAAYALTAVSQVYNGHELAELIKMKMMGLSQEGAPNVFIKSVAVTYTPEGPGSRIFHVVANVDYVRGISAYVEGPSSRHPTYGVSMEFIRGWSVLPHAIRRAIEENNFQSTAVKIIQEGQQQ